MATYLNRLAASLITLGESVTQMGATSWAADTQLAPDISRCGRAVNKLKKYFRVAAQNPELYQCSSCFTNSGELARRVLSTFRVSVDHQDLKILVVIHQNFPRYFTPDFNLNLILAPSKVFLYPANARPLEINQARLARDGWKFHAIVEYQGNILDFDWDGPEKVIPVAEYFQKMFPMFSMFHAGQPTVQNNWDHFLIYQMPASTYLAKFPNGRPGRKFDDSVYTSPSSTISEFIRQYETELRQPEIKPYLPYWATP